MSATKFHTRTEQRAILWFYTSWSLTFWIANWKKKDFIPNNSKHSLPSIYVNFFLNRILFVNVVPKYLNSSTLSMDLLSIFVLWFHPAFWSRDIIMYLVLSTFTSSPISLVATTKASAFSSTVCTLPWQILIAVNIVLKLLMMDSKSVRNM